MSSTIYLWLFMILLWPMAIGGCHDNDAQADRIPTGPCRYEEIMGHATIITIQETAENDSGCENAVEILFSFTPTDPSVRNTYRFSQYPDNGQRLTVGAGLNPPIEWARRIGLVEGATLRCIRKELIQGTCTPVIFDFPDLDFTGWEKWCFKPSPKKS